MIQNKKHLKKVTFGIRMSKKEETNFSNGMPANHYGISGNPNSGMLAIGLNITKSAKKGLDFFGKENKAANRASRH